MQISNARDRMLAHWELLNLYVKGPEVAYVAGVLMREGSTSLWKDMSGLEESRHPGRRLY